MALDTTIAQTILQTGVSVRSNLKTIAGGQGFLQTGGSIRGILQTIKQGLAFLKTGSRVISNLRVYSIEDKALILRPTITFVSTTSPYLQLGDSTGIYNGTTNTTGYTSPCPGSVERPCRTELDLYVWYQTFVMNEAGDAVINSDAFYVPQNDPAADPYLLDMFDIPSGIIAFYLIGVPTGTVLTEYQKQYLYYISEGEEDWFNGQVGYLNDDDLINDLRQMQIKWLNGYMLEKCPGLIYRQAYGMYLVVQNALLTFNYYQAVRMYDILKAFVAANIDNDCCN